jgi:hypothetical protein
MWTCENFASLLHRLSLYIWLLCSYYVPMCIILCILLLARRYTHESGVYKKKINGKTIHKSLSLSVLIINSWWSRYMSAAVFAKRYTIGGPLEGLQSPKSARLSRCRHECLTYTNSFRLHISFKSVPDCHAPPTGSIIISERI